jgi:hypothetical protein
MVPERFRGDEDTSAASRAATGILRGFRISDASLRGMTIQHRTAVAWTGLNAEPVIVVQQ